jgi:predicted dehydrogenase
MRERRRVAHVRREPLLRPKYVRAKQLADEGALGDVYYVRQLECHFGPHSEWFWDVERSGGGVLMDMGCHSIAYCRWVFGDAPIESVHAEVGNFVHKERTKGDDHSVVTLRFAPTERHPNGGLGIAENSWARIGGLDDRAEIYGSKGLTVADIARGSALNTFSAEGYGYAAEKSPLTRGWTWTGYEEAWNYGFPGDGALGRLHRERHATDAHRRGRPRRAGDRLRGVRVGADGQAGAFTLRDGGEAAGGFVVAAMTQA